MYCYCANDPINYYDPSGHFVISTLALIIIGTAVLTTAGVIIYGAVTETPVVLDISVTILIKLKEINPKVGFSLVFDFKNKNVEGYFHAGGNVGFFLLVSDILLGSLKITRIQEIMLNILRMQE